jgi:hypothetical protein
MSNRKGLGFEVDIGNMGIGGLLGFLIGVGIPLALSAYVFFGQIITLDLLSELKDSPHYQNAEKQQELTEIYASAIIVLVLTGSALLGGAYVLGAGLVGLASSGSLFVNVK